MITWGINALNHGSSLAVFENGRLINWSSCSSDKLDRSIILEGIKNGGPGQVFWYEKPLLKKVRQLRAGQWNRAIDFSVMPKNYLKQAGLGYAQLRYTPHHASHAAAGYYTSPFNNCAVVVLDAIGEFECASIWQGQYGELKRLWSSSYPNSLGLFYSAFTQLINLKPVEQEHLLQQMAEQGDPDRFYTTVKDYFDYSRPVKLTKNLHRGVLDWPYTINTLSDQCDIAAAVQRVFEEQVIKVMTLAKQLTGSDSLVYMGGCAMNSRANQKISSMWKYQWSLADPGDPSSAVGAVLYHTKHREWNYKFGTVKHLEIRV
jgi:carbamoyltransferase